MLRRAALCLLLCTLSLGGGSNAIAASEVFVTAAGAINGYDVVAYHTEHRALLGSEAITQDWNGATWRFASVSNRELFTKDPARYAPRYGGYCAYGTAQGYKVSTQPEAFAVVDGVLYLNYNTAVQQTWNKDRPAYIATANDNWVALEHSVYESDAASTAAERK